MLKTLKQMIGLQEEKDDTLDEKLMWIIESARLRLKVLLGGIDPQAERRKK